MPLPLAGWAEGRLRRLAATLDTDALAGLSGDGLLRMRAHLNGLRIPGQVSAGGGCRFYQTRDGWIALNLARPDDVDLLPALFGTAEAVPSDPAGLTGLFAQAETAALLAQGRLLGMAIAALDERPASPAAVTTIRGAPKPRGRGEPPVVIDFSALWAGPLASRLLQLGGARVVRIESPARPDRMREGDPALFDWLNADKALLPMDLRSPAARAELLALISGADVVIEAARPRALQQLGIDAEALVRAVPGLVWLTITGHGTSGAAGEWVGFGDDAAVAGGLSAALHRATGKIGFVGDAIADPLTGLLAAGEAAERLADGQAARVVISMSGTVAQAIDETTRTDRPAFTADLAAWAAAEGQPLAAS